MYNDAIVCDENALPGYLKEGYTIAAIYYVSVPTSFHHSENGTSGGANFSRSGSVDGERQCPRFVLSRTPTSQVLYGK